MPTSALDPYLEELFDGLVSDLTRRPPGATTLRPILRVHDTDTAFEVELPVPGVALEDLTVRYAEGVLTIHGPGLHRSAFFPAAVDAARISFRLDDGVLVVEAPKVSGDVPLF